MNNKDFYKKAVDQIHPKEDLKNETFFKIKEKQKQNKNIKFVKYLAVATVLVLVCVLGIAGTKYNSNRQSSNSELLASTETKITKVKNDLPRFQSMEELKEVLAQNDLYSSEVKSSQEEIAFDSTTTTNSTNVEELDTSSAENYSTTNVQVENVDEADIVKTDGDYIYYVANSKVYIVKADTLEIMTKIENNDEMNKFNPSEIFINKDKLVILGNYFENEVTKTTTEIVSISDANIIEDSTSSFTADVARISSTELAKAYVYDISNPKEPTLKREVVLDGYYSNSRMIGDSVYFISKKSAYYTSQMKDEEILPTYKDTAVSEDLNKVDCTDIVYFQDTKSYMFTMVAGFNINNNEEISLETFFGASSTIYASENNLYLTQVSYTENYSVEKNTIYKFSLDNSQVVLKCKGEVEGNLKSQYSIDEYEGNLRIATTLGSGDDTTNVLYVLDENLQEIGKLDNLANGEKIYAVRFINDVGYIVTFKQIDPLFVIDLSNPSEPSVKGELKIPGYSSYLHPYDETHIIGIGYNVKTASSGGTTNTSIKMAMFDVSDLENPKEMFSVNIGMQYSYSDIMTEPKALFYNTSKNLIGFPATLRVDNSGYYKNAFVLYKIDLENGFEEYGNILQSQDYRTNIRRGIYIGDTLYTLAYRKIVSYDLNTMEKLDEVEIESME
jgi:uncharacterized secreted protein with C-terminal beta-propeller domain